MRKILKVICCVFAFTFCFGLVGCDTDDKTYDVKFMVDGQIWFEAECAEIDELPTASKDYCDFAGWYCNGEKIEEIDDINKDMTLEAKFRLKSNYTCLKSLSSSMHPTIENGDFVLVDTSVTSYNVGDIIAYEKNDLQIMHRIVEISGETYITKGDANTDNGPSISKSEIIGKVVYIIGETLPSDVIA